jgi:1,2-diacylglycerol-3-alpha-glucose alpha-1,2-glucosyltransferase
MRVCLYLEAEKIIARSAFRTAFSQQRRALEQAGVTLVENPRQSFDILHLHWFGPRSFLLLKRAKQEGRKVIVHAHSIGGYDLRNSFTLSNAFAPLYERYLKYFYDLSDCIFTPSVHAKQFLVSQGLRKPIAVVSNGIDRERFRFSERRRAEFRTRLGLRRFTIFCAGNVIPRKGVMEFIDVAERLPEYDFVWYGHCWNKLLAFYPEMHKRLAQRPSNLLMPGFVEDTPGAFSAGDLLFYPSHGETQGMVLLEAASLRKPIVLQDLPEYKDLGFVHEENCLAGQTQDEFAAHIDRIAKDAMLCERLANAAERLAKANAIEGIGRRLKGLYEAVLNEQMVN